jgi:hypothetical protein
MGSNWENFLQNQGEWQGSFTQVSPTGELLGSTPSILSLEPLENDRAMRFRLRRFATDDYSQEPISDYQQEYRSLGRQIVFFDTGAFSKGSLQLSPISELGAEYGFVAGDRRLRCVQLFDLEGNFTSLTLIREFRSGTDAQERPPLTVEQLLGKWEGQAVTAYADWRNPDTYATSLEIKQIAPNSIEQKLVYGDRVLNSTATIEGNILNFTGGSQPRKILLLPDGASSNVPVKVNWREPCFVEAGWLVTTTERQRLIRSYNEKGEWISSTHIIERKVPFDS